MGKVEANGTRFFVQRMGEGSPPVVFVHGLVLDNLSSWYYTVANAVARESEVICYDLRGHGMSDRPLTGYTIDDSVADLAALLDALEVQGPVHVVGNSYGGVVGLALADRHPERVAGLVLVEAHAPLQGQSEREMEQLAHGLDLASEFLNDDDVNDWVDTFGGRKLKRMAAAAKVLLYETSLVDDLRASAPFTEDQLRAVPCPVLLVYGEESDIIDRGRDLARLLPHGVLHVIDGVDHDVLMGATDDVRRLVTEWVGGGYRLAAAARPGPD